MGYPHPDIMGGEPKLTEGIINATTGIADDPRLVQISVAMQAGNSGGPLLNMQGEVIGVVCAKLDALMVWAGSGDLPENVGYAIKVGYVRTFLESAGARAAPAGTGQPPAEASLEELAARIRPSVMLVIAE
jgi:S1-C subfamily serine protease